MARQSATPSGCAAGPGARISPRNVLVLVLYVALAVLLVVSPPPG